VLSSLGGPGGTGLIGRGRTRGGSNNDEVGLSVTVDTRGDADVNRTSCVDEKCRCWGGGGGTSLGSVGRGGAGACVPGGDHAGGGVLGRMWPVIEVEPEVELGSGGWGSLGGWGSGRDLPDGRLTKMESDRDQDNTRSSSGSKDAMKYLRWW
jgi:hypothetical protein